MHSINSTSFCVINKAIKISVPLGKIPFPRPLFTNLRRNVEGISVRLSCIFIQFATELSWNWEIFSCFCPFFAVLIRKNNCPHHLAEGQRSFRKQGKPLMLMPSYCWFIHISDRTLLGTMPMHKVPFRNAFSRREPRIVHLITREAVKEFQALFSISKLSSRSSFW